MEIEKKLRRNSRISQVGDQLIEVEKSETESVKLSVYKDYFRAAGWSLSLGTFVLYFIFQGRKFEISRFFKYTLFSTSRSSFFVI
jgi:hypothetical protein